MLWVICEIPTKNQSHWKIQNVGDCSWTSTFVKNNSIKMTKFAESLRSERCKGICAVHTRTTWAKCRASRRSHVLDLFSLAQTAQSAFCTFFIFFPRLRCAAAVLLFLRRCIVFRPDDASQKRFSWFSDWIQKAQRNVKDACKSDRFRHQISKGYLVFTV